MTCRKWLDPDEYLKKYGNEQLKKYLLENQLNVYEYIYNVAKTDLILDDVVSVQRFAGCQGNEPDINEMRFRIRIGHDAIQNGLAVTDKTGKIPVEIYPFNQNFRLKHKQPGQQEKQG